MSLHMVYNIGTFGLNEAILQVFKELVKLFQQCFTLHSKFR